MISELRAATRSHHVALEDALPLMRPGLSEAVYKTVLLRFLGIYAPLEKAVAQHHDALAVLGIDLHARRKCPLLEQDLMALGVSASSIAEIARASVPAMHSVAAALGALYVMEGATLGGQIISRHLRDTLELTPLHGAAFFSAYGPAVGPMWKEFVRALELPQAPRDAQAVREATNAACALFVTFLQFAALKDAPA